MGEIGMISMQEAVKVATESIRTLFGYPHPSGLRVEEIDRTEDGFWDITMGYDGPQRSSVLGMSTSREYKVFRIRADDGEVVSMKIRSIE
jgi:hypothetical protein